MDQLIINGNGPLRGDVVAAGAKNAAVCKAPVSLLLFPR